MTVINVDQIANTIMQELEIYQQNVVEDVEYAVKLVAKETAAELRETSPIGPTGEYAPSWSHRRAPDAGKDFMSMVVYSKKPQYRVTHVLEKGHEAVDGSWVGPRPHIAPAEEKAGIWMADQLTKRVSR